MRIVHLSSLYPPAALGGAERVASLLAEAQAAAGHEVIASSLTRTPQSAGERHGVKTMPLKARNPLWIEESARFPGPIRLANKAATVLNPVTASQFAALLDAVQPDVVHTHSMVELPAAIWAKAASRAVPIVHTLHDYDLLCIRAALFKDGRRCVPRHLACRVLSAPKRAHHHHIDIVAAVSATVLDRHLEYGLFTHLAPERRHVVWNPVALNTHAGERARRQPGETFCFGFLGRLVQQKGLGLLLDACRLLPPAGWSLRIAGMGPDEAAFREQAAGLPIEFVGFADAAEFLAGIDVLVVAPLWDEPFGLTTLEAYAAGVRVIGARVGIIGELIDRVDPGWSVAPADVQALAAAMTRAMQPAESFAVGNASALLDRLRPATVAAGYVDLYAQAIAAAR